jgi:hypothetical protein
MGSFEFQISNLKFQISNFSFRIRRGVNLRNALAERNRFLGSCFARQLTAFQDGRHGKRTTDCPDDTDKKTPMLNLIRGIREIRG